MPILNIIHMALHVTDMERSIAFYGTLGWGIGNEDRRYEPGFMTPVEVSPLSQHGGGTTLITILSLGTDPRQATKLELVQYVDPAPKPKPFKPREEVGVHRIAMRVKGIDAMVADLREKGIVIPEDVKEITTMGGKHRYVLLPDPDENIVELIELIWN